MASAEGASTSEMAVEAIAEAPTSLGFTAGTNPSTIGSNIRPRGVEEEKVEVESLVSQELPHTVIPLKKNARFAGRLDEVSSHHDLRATSPTPIARGAAKPAYDRIERRSPEVTPSDISRSSNPSLDLLYPSSYQEPALATDHLMKLPPNRPNYVRGNNPRVPIETEYESRDANYFLIAGRRSAQAQNTSARGRRTGLRDEESFLARPSISFIIPDHLKSILVDDWENVTKSQLLVPLPAEQSANSILRDYLESEKKHRPEGSAEADILDEVVKGLGLYFDKCLGRILLYRFERVQYLEICQAMADGDLAGKSIGDIYGAEHLCRLLVSLPELIAQTNMDLQSVHRLREELSKLAHFLVKKAAAFFAPEYETPVPGYVEKARANV